MTYKIFINWEYSNETEVWDTWCRDHLVENNRITWAWVSNRNGKEPGILFATEEDAMAFRLKFGL
jgi:hypothetical protein